MRALFAILLRILPPPMPLFTDRDLQEADVEFWTDLRDEALLAGKMVAARAYHQETKDARALLVALDRHEGRAA